MLLRCSSSQCSLTHFFQGVHCLFSLLCVRAGGQQWDGEQYWEGIGGAWCRWQPAGSVGFVMGGAAQTSLSVEGLRGVAQPVSGRAPCRSGVAIGTVLMLEHSDCSSCSSCSVSVSSREPLLAWSDTVSVFMHTCSPPRDGLICFRSSQYSSSLESRQMPSTILIFSLV